jgi:RNA polymerase sigma factor (sigma-70 family)
LHRDATEAAEQVYAGLIEPVAERMMRLAQRITRNDDKAADAFQQAIVQIWMRLPEILAHPNPHGYVLRTVASAAYDVLRRDHRRRRGAELLRVEGAAAAPSAETLAGGKLAALDIGDAIARLSRAQAEAVALRLVAEESFETIAAALGCSPETARSHYSKGRARLRTLLEPYEGGARDAATAGDEVSRRHRRVRS